MLRIFTQCATQPKLKNWKFTRRNINRIAYNYDAVVEKFDTEIKFATLRLSTGPLMMIDEVTKRQVRTK